MKSVVLVAAMAGIALSCGPRRDASKATAAVVKPITVTSALPVVRQVRASYTETGSFVADESSDIAPPVAGRVIATPVNVGEFVKKGQVICELDHRDAQLKLDQAQAQLAQAVAAVKQAQLRIGLTTGSFNENAVPEVAGAKANYESAEAQARLAAADSQRYANLVATGDVSQSAFEKAKTQQETAEAQAHAARQQYEAALNTARQSYQIVSSSEASLSAVRAQVAQAEKGLADTAIQAPFDGYIAERPVAVGEYVALTSKIANIVRVKTLKLQLQTPEQRAAKAKLGMEVLARVAAYPDRDFSGKVSAVNPSIDPNSRIFLLEARFDNPDNALRPGMFATAHVFLPGGEDAVFVPATAVNRDKTTDSNQVYIVRDGQAHLRVVLVGDAAGGAIRILSGISGSEPVITGSQGTLYDGAPVNAQGTGRS